jgi:hydroxymethylbilane synthase
VSITPLPQPRESETTHTVAASATAPFVVGTRGSALALWQTDWVLERLRESAPRTRFTIATIKTQGDHTQQSGTPLAQLGALGDKGLFVAELERALLTREVDIAIAPMQDRALAEAEAQAVRPNPAIDLAVHSLKDLPSTLTQGLALAAVTAREDPRDALISRAGYTLAQLPDGATVATSSLRRQAQLLHRRPDLRIVAVRGNVDTRLRKALAPDGPDAMLLAVAGLKRLGREAVITEYLGVDLMVPAAGQGALAVEVRAEDTRLRRLVHRLDDAPTHRAVLAERTVLAALGGGCLVPVGAHATPIADGALLRLLAVVAAPDGRRLIRVAREGPARRAVALGRLVARELRRQGADAIVRGVLEGARR